MTDLEMVHKLVKILDDKKGRNIIALDLKGATIIADYLYIMKSTDIYSNEIGKVYKDEVFNIMSIEKTDERTWYEIETKQGIRGYIRDDESFWGDRTKQTIKIGKAKGM